MNVYTYWKWEEYLTPDQCKMILAERAKLPEMEAVVGEGSEVNESRRRTNVVWVNENHWLNGALFNLGRIANESAYWNFTISSPEKLQLARYTDNGFYDNHHDVGVDSSSHIRKISVVALLNDPSEYDGGEFVFNNKTTVPLKLGDVIAFPSVTEHGVKPVTKGERYSAACWISGPK
jgi:PKHD-type hydroxylase